MRQTGDCGDGMLLVRPASVDEPARSAEGVAYVVVEAGYPPEEPPLARCLLVRLDEQVAEIRDLVVVEPCRRRGIATRLVSEIADVLRAAGARRLLGVHDGARWLDLEL